LSNTRSGVLEQMARIWQGVMEVRDMEGGNGRR
jgi:hypothetical protein